MKILLTLAVSTIATTFSGVTTNTVQIEEEYQEVYNFFNENINEMTSSYYIKNNVLWNASQVEEITDIYNTEDEKIGYLVIFDKGYISYNTNMSVLDVCHEGYPSYYKTTFNHNKPKVIYDSGSFNNQIASYDMFADNIYYPLEDYYLKDGFQINSSMVQIPYFKDKYPSSDWGNYMGISFSYGGENAGGVLSAMGLMYTLKVNGGVDLTPYQTSYKSFRQQLYFYTAFDYTYTSFIELQVLSAGINQYLSDNFGDKYVYAITGVVHDTVPAVTLYYNSNSLYTAEYCMRVGHAQEPDWWIFNTYYDIVMEDHNNFYLDEYEQPDLWIDNSLTPFYVVNQNYRNEMFQFFEGNTLLK